MKAAPGTDPSRLDLPRLAQTTQTLAGQWPGADLPRLALDTVGPPSAVDWSIRAEQRPVTGAEPELWLRLECGCQVDLICQRCLQTVSQALRVAQSIRFVRDEALAEVLDEHSDEDVLALPPGGLDLRALVEDELILALPLVPRHEACPQPLPLSRDEPAETAAHPFEALAALKRRPPGQE